MKICYFGTYESQYPRNRVLIQGLEQNGIDVIQVHQGIWEKETNKTGKYLSCFSLFKLSFILAVKLSRLLIKIIPLLVRIDVIITGYIGQLDIIIVKLLTLFNRKTIIFNPLISLYSTLVEDRGVFKKNSIKARAIFLLDKISFKLTDFIITDTNKQLEYIKEKFNIRSYKIKRIFVGSDERYFYPKDANESIDKFKVLFYGKFIPLHGIEYIVRAAKILEYDSDIEFMIIGKGQLKEEITRLTRKLSLGNIVFIDWVPYDKLGNYISSSSVCLGIFSNTAKARRVIPNKVFQIIASRGALITADTQAVRELLKDHKDSLLCKPASEEALAYAIQLLKDNPALRSNIKETGYQTFKKCCSTRLLGKQLLDVIKKDIL